jgi:hypothetical protein
MPNTTIALTPNAWTLITSADAATAVTFQVRGGAAFVAATTDTTPPSVTPPYAGVLYPDSFGEQGKTIPEIFPGVPTGDRLFGYTSQPGVEVFVSF